MIFSPQEISHMGFICSLITQYHDGCQEAINKLEEKRIRTPEQIEKMRHAVECNSIFFQYIITKATTVFHSKVSTAGFEIPLVSDPPPLNNQDLSELSDILKEAAFSWTSIGDEERFHHYEPIMKAIHTYTPANGIVFVPGAKLCRLACEIAAQNYTVFANESDFVFLDLSQIAIKTNKKFEIFPFLHQISGLDDPDHALISASFPRSGKSFLSLEQSNDAPELQLNPKQLIADGKIFFLGCNFGAVLHQKPEQFDSIVTSFFLDNLKNPFNAINLIHKIAKPDGIWINFGPIIPRSQGSDFFSLETLEDIDDIAQQIGWTKLHEERIQTTNHENPYSHMKTFLNCKLTVFKK